jgi:hypothetical protein
MNQPRSVCSRVAAVAYGSARVHVCQAFFGWRSGAPLNQLAVGGSSAQGWSGPVWLTTWSWTTLIPWP